MDKGTKSNLISKTFYAYIKKHEIKYMKKYLIEQQL